MDNVGDNVNESVESSFHSKETKENTSPAELKKAWSIRVRTLVNLFVASLRWFLSLLFLKPVAYFKNSITMRRKKRSKDPKTARVFVMNDLSSFDKLLLFHRSKYPVKMNYIGMDCEWVSKKGQVNAPVALLQIATPLCDCFLVRLCKMDGQMPQIVKEILEDKAVLKFGVGIQDDAKRLLEMFGIHARGCVDLRHVAQRIQWENGDQSCQKMSLDALAKRILGVKLNKSWSIQCSNWEEEKLSTQQVEYAMNDALVASHIFLMLVKEKARKSSDLDICNRDEGTNQSSAMITGKCHPDSSETCLNLEQSRENVEINLTGPEAAAGDNEHHDSPPSEFAENRNLNQEGKYQEKLDDENTKISCERSVVKGDGDLFPDFQICDKSFQSLASGADYYEATVDLSKFESDEMAGYFSRDKVISLISDPYFTQRAGLLCQGVIDMAFKTRKRKVVLIDKDGNSLSPEKSLKPYKCGTTRKSPLYMNCMLTAPDGSRLCGVSREKADWYIDKGLGHKTNNDPYTVQLNFTPAKRPGTEDHCLNFYINRCVVCGAHESYMRKNIVPHDYRRHFPPEMKDHHSHDILLTCPRCHSLANFFDDHLRKELAIEYNAPLGNATDSRFKEDPVLRKVKAAARALSHPVKRKMKAKALSHPDERKMKADKQQKFSLIVQNHFGTSALTLEMIRHAATMETRKENANFKSHGLKVFERVHSEGKLLEFEEMWRKHFVDKMDPKFLPKSWSIDRPRESVKSKMGILISCSGGPYMQYTVNNFSA